MAPGRKKFVKKTFKKKTFKRKTKPMVLSRVSLGHGFPEQLKVTHKYTDEFILTTTSGTTQVYSFAANGMYDPNVVGSGHQPLYFDQCSNLYDHYCVIGARLDLLIVNSTTGIGVPVAFSLSLNDDNSQAVSNPFSVYEQANSRFRVLAPGANQSQRMSLNWSAKKVFGGRDILNDNSLQGSGTSNPTELSQYMINVRPADYLSTVSVYVYATLTQIAIWKELKDIGQS